MAGLAAAAQRGTLDATVVQHRLASRAVGVHQGSPDAVLSKLGEGLNGTVLFAVEMIKRDSTAPAVAVRVKGAQRLRDSLDEVVRQLPGYEYELISEQLISVRPRGAKTDPTNILNTIVARVDLIDEPPGNVLGYPDDYIPELKTRMKGSSRPSQLSAPRRPGRGITLHLNNVTVREILNAVSEASIQQQQRPGKQGRPEPPRLEPLGWTYSFDPATETHHWKWLRSLPFNWEELLTREALAAEP
jgi:hypothetical protein